LSFVCVRVARWLLTDCQSKRVAVINAKNMVVDGFSLYIYWVAQSFPVVKNSELRLKDRLVMRLDSRLLAAIVCCLFGEYRYRFLN
jgi:hypothetical protein